MILSHIGEPMTVPQWFYCFNIFLIWRHRRLCNQYFFVHIISKQKRASSSYAKKLVKSLNLPNFAGQILLIRLCIFWEYKKIYAPIYLSARLRFYLTLLSFHFHNHHRFSCHSAYLNHSACITIIGIA